MKDTFVKLLNIESLDDIIGLTKILHPKILVSELKNRQTEMFTYNNYKCFGLFNKGNLIGVASGWVTTRLYCDKQIELDNVIIKDIEQSKGFGKIFMDDVEIWAKNNNCRTIELNSYVTNGRSHKFYLNQGYKIIAFHFQKNIF